MRGGGILERWWVRGWVLGVRRGWVVVSLQWDRAGGGPEMPEVCDCSLVGHGAEWLHSRQCLFESSGWTLTLIISNAKTPWGALANPAGSDMMCGTPS